MKTLIILMATLLLCLDAVGRTTVVAVIDTGINTHKFIPGKNGICKTGHQDFTFSGLEDDYGHGTNVSGLIHKQAKHTDYCQIIIKYWKGGIGSKQELNNMINALKYVSSIKVDIVNISAGGPVYNSEEHELIKKLLDKGVIIIAAAGNHKKMLNSVYCNKEGSQCNTYNFFPAGYDPRIIVVGNTYNTGEPYFNSNYGEVVDEWRHGVNVSGDFGGPEMTGTSQAAAIFTGEYARRISDPK